MTAKGPGIVVKNLNSRFRISERFVKKIAEKILHILKNPKSAYLDIVFLNDDDIRVFNRRYKHENRVTDVLSFDLGHCAQILISSDTALTNSRRFGTSFEEEIILYVVHGILHLSGYDDETKAQKKRMSSKESSIIRRLCQKNFSKVLTPR